MDAAAEAETGVHEMDSDEAGPEDVMAGTPETGEQ